MQVRVRLRGTAFRVGCTRLGRTLVGCVPRWALSVERVLRRCATGCARVFFCRTPPGRTVCGPSQRSLVPLRAVAVPRVPFCHSRVRLVVQGRVPRPLSRRSVPRALPLVRPARVRPLPSSTGPTRAHPSGSRLCRSCSSRLRRCPAPRSPTRPPPLRPCARGPYANGEESQCDSSQCDRGPAKSCRRIRTRVHPLTKSSAQTTELSRSFLPSPSRFYLSLLGATVPTPAVRRGPSPFLLSRSDRPPVRGRALRAVRTVGLEHV